jgi:hypothetical protein
MNEFQQLAFSLRKEFEDGVRARTDGAVEFVFESNLANYTEFLIKYIQKIEAENIELKDTCEKLSWNYNIAVKDVGSFIDRNKKLKLMLDDVLNNDNTEVKSYTSKSTANIVGKGLVKVVTGYLKDMGFDVVANIDGTLYKIKQVEYRAGYADRPIDIGLTVKLIEED